MFLKQIEMQGFKSFADRTIIQFDHPITGIVGPNGCGKSNIADSVRWVLGEQSAKSMRGDKMNDVIFAGSADRRRVNMAEVTLVFDNTNHILNDDKDEIEVTRRLFRDSGEAEYLINRKNVRLKDVVDLFLDTGLGKDSLSIISQGNVLSFAEAKPLERRGIFEEAAGVAKYKKRKLESLSKLERTKANLDRSNDILIELEKQVSPLKRQARKAEIYREKKKRLEEIEISVLVQDIESIHADIETAKKALFDIETKTTMFSTDIQINETKLSESRRQISTLDREINDLQDELMKKFNEIAGLEARRTELDEKRKYIVETGTNEQKAKQLAGLIEEARVEYEDRQKRLDDLNTEIRLYSQQLSAAAANIVDKRSEYDQASNRLRSLENRKNVIDQLMRNPFNNQQGIRSIMENQNALSGILGVIGQVLQVENGYEEAVSTALGAAMNHIVTVDEQAARDAIRFLNRNQSGRATFLPLTVCTPRYVSQDNQIICQNTKGYLGVAADFVKNNDQFEPVITSLLNNVLVVEDMEAGNELSTLTKRLYKIVTLSGEVIHRGGSMTGGASKNHQQQSLVKRNSQLETLEQQLNQLKEYEKQVSEKWNQLETKWNEIVQKGTAIQEEETLLKQQLQEVRLELQFSKDEFNKISRQTLSQQYELDESIEQYEQLEQQYVETHEALRRITKENQAVKKELDYLQLSQEDRTQQLQEKQQELQEVGTQKARIQEQVQHQKKEFKQEKLSLKRLEEQVHLLESKKDEQKDLKEKNEADYNQTIKDYEAIKETVTVLEADLDRLKEERIQLEVLNKQTEVSRNQAQHQLQEYLKQQSKVETKANRFELAIDQKLQYLSEEYELTFEAAIEKTELTMSIEDASKAVRSLKQQIEQMGAVNLMAIEEYDKVQERFEFLTIQQQDLLDAKKNLEDTITEMDTEVTSRFKQTFDAISSQFQQTFPRLFGGGRASLELTDPTNLLETGIEIIAQPPGKKLQSLSLLSGGERAFTAIALLFAILEVKPVPFCLLDEVEAALDEANVARYGRYLKEFTKNTQFIVITHRRGTMEEADVLYGVTMQESGVSKLASVKFEDFDELEEAK